MKNNLKSLKKALLAVQAAVLGCGLLVLFLVMLAGYREKVLHILMLRLEASTENMASQLKANQVPFSSAQTQGVFIINQNDGSIVIDRHNDPENLWPSYRDKLVYEMQKQKRGWIVYPDKQWWNLRQKQKIIRYIPIDELGWVLAVEAPKPTEIGILKEAIKPAIVWTLFSLYIFGIGLLWSVTAWAFQEIKHHISKVVENNLISRGGEEKVWEEFAHQAPQTSQEDLEREAAGLNFRPPAAPQSQLPLSASARDIPLEAIEEKPAWVAPQKARPKKETKQDQGDPLTVNLNKVSSPALKKALQKFRNK